MSDFQFPLLIASIDSDLQLSIPQQAQSFFSSFEIKPSSPTIVISCFNSTSTLFPNLLNNLLSSCSITLPTTPGIWLRHLFQQPVVSKSTSVASPPRDSSTGQVSLIFDVVTAGLNDVRAPSSLPHSFTLFPPHTLTPMLQEQQARLFSLAYSLSSHVLVDSESCELSADFSFATAIAEHIKVSASPFAIHTNFNRPTAASLISSLDFGQRKAGFRSPREP
jgi:hypothetical protein